MNTENHDDHYFELFRHPEYHQLIADFLLHVDPFHLTASDEPILTLLHIAPAQRTDPFVLTRELLLIEEKWRQWNAQQIEKELQ